MVAPVLGFALGQSLGGFLGLRFGRLLSPMGGMPPLSALSVYARTSTVRPWAS